MSTNANPNQTEASEQDQATAEQAGKPETAGAASSKADPASEIARLTAERAELNDRLLRNAAEFENYKRRIKKDNEDAAFRTTESMLKEILPPLDNLDRALMASNNSTDEKAVKALIEGMQMVQKQFFAALERFSVKAFDVERGQPFDPQFHEAVQQVESDSLPPGSVAAVFQRGYKAGTRLLRPAVVSVVRGSSEKTSN